MHMYDNKKNVSRTAVIIVLIVASSVFVYYNSNIRYSYHLWKLERYLCSIKLPEAVEPATTAAYLEPFVSEKGLVYLLQSANARNGNRSEVALAGLVIIIQSEGKTLNTYTWGVKKPPCQDLTKEVIHLAEHGGTSQVRAVMQSYLNSIEAHPDKHQGEYQGEP